MHIDPSKQAFVSKRWGWEQWIVNNDKYCGKLLFIKQGQHCSFHHHAVKEETLYVQDGVVRFVYQKPGMGMAQSLIIHPGHAFHVMPGDKHQMEALTDVLIIEFSTTHRDEDSIRTTTDLVVSER